MAIIMMYCNTADDTMKQCCYLCVVISYLDDHHHLPHRYPDLSCEVMRHWNVEIFYLFQNPCYLSSLVTV